MNAKKRARMERALQRYEAQIEANQRVITEFEKKEGVRDHSSFFRQQIRRAEIEIARIRANLEK